MSASANDLVRNAAPNFATTLSASMAESDTSMTLSSVVGLPTGTGITLTIDATNASGISTPAVKETVTGIVSSSQVVNLKRGQDGTTQQSHATGANVVMWITANLWNDFQSSFLSEHNQDGTHSDITADSLTVDGQNVLTLMPSGAVVPFAGSSAPSGFLFCQGQAVSRATYATLFGAISTTYGTGDGSTTFNLPNLQGNVPVGLKSGDSNFGALGDTGGEKTHVLTTPEMPAHTHAPGGGHTSFVTTGSDGDMQFAGGTNSRDEVSATASTGGGGAHNNLQPFITLNYLIKT